MNRRVLSAGLILVVPLLGILYANLGRDPHTVESPLIGRAAPPFALRPVGGGDPIALASQRGRPVVLNFWSTWCVPCLEEHATLLSAARALGSEVQFLGIVYDDEEAAVQRFLQQRGTAYPSLMDDGGKTAIAYGIFGVPESFFIDREGRIVSKFVGPLNPDTLGTLVRKAGALGQ